MNDLLKKRMSATQQAAEIVVGDEAYETLFRGAPAPEASRFCELPMDKLRPFFTADIGFHPYPPEKLKAFSQQLAEQGIYERVIVRPIPDSNDYADPGYATVYKVTDHVLAELLGRTPSLYTPPRTQFITEKGDVVDAPLIKAPGKAGGPHRK